MKAVQIARHGGPEVMEVREVPDPVAGPGQIVADIHAASVSPGDIKDAQGVRDDVQIIRPVVSRDRKHLERIAELVVNGGVRPPETRRFPLAAARAAHELLESGTLRGKIVLETVRAIT